MKAGRAILSYAKGLHLGKIKIHFHRGLGSRDQLKDELDVIDSQFLAGFAYLLGGDDKADRSIRRSFPHSCVNLALRPFRQEGAKHIGGPAGHRVSHHYVLADGFFHEALGCDNPDSPRFNVLIRDDPFHSSPVVDVAVRIDHRHDGLLREMLVTRSRAALADSVEIRGSMTI